LTALIAEEATESVGVAFVVVGDGFFSFLLTDNGDFFFCFFLVSCLDEMMMLLGSEGFDSSKGLSTEAGVQIRKRTTMTMTMTMTMMMTTTTANIVSLLHGYINLAIYAHDALKGNVVGVVVVVAVQRWRWKKRGNLKIR